MTPTPPTGPTQPPRNKSAGKPSRAAALLHFIQTLIRFGQQRLADLETKLTPEETQNTGIAFGTFNLPLILARIMRGLRIATALQDRIAANATQIDAPTRPRQAAEPRPKRAPRRPKPTQSEDDAALLARIPTDREIAELLRHRPIGVILIDICSDLGIGIQHPLWQDVRRFLDRHQGRELPVIERSYQRLNTARQEVMQGIAPNWRFYSHPEQTAPPPKAASA